VQAELNETSLGEAGVAIRRFKDACRPAVMARARKLVVTPENQYVAERILRTSQRVGTTDNDINAVRDVLGLTYTVNDFITNTKAWFLLTT
jgi:phosphopantetheine adenylyltransferase